MFIKKQSNNTMKKLLVFAALAASVIGAQAQIAISMNFNSPTPGVRIHVYGTNTVDPTIITSGNTSADLPAGTVVYTGAKLSGSGYTAQIWASVPATGSAGINQAESSLVAVTNRFYTTVFKTGVNVGYPLVATGTETIGIPDANGNPIPSSAAPYSCTAQLRAWDNKGGTITNWAGAVAANSPRGKSGLWNVAKLLGSDAPPSTAFTQPNDGSVASFALYVDPNITTQPIATSAECGSGSATFTVAATSSTGTVTYQWYKGNAAVANATNASLSFNPVHAADADTYTVIVTSSLGVATSAGAILTVTDTATPVITLNGGNVTSELGAAYVDAGASSSDACAGSVAISGSGTVNTNLVGVYTVTFTSGSATPVLRTVTVVDTTAPSIALNGTSPVSVECHSAYTDLGVTASDASGSVTLTTNGTVTVNSAGFYTVTYTATDASLNSRSVARVVHVVDTTAPTIALVGSDTVSTHKGAAYVDAGVTTSDACSGSVTVNTTGSVDTNTVGVYTLTFTASDSADNTSAPVTRTVSVIDSGFTITSQPASATNAYSTTATFSVGVDFPAGLSYQWAKNGTSLSDAGTVAGSATSSLTISSLVKTNSGTYTCTVSGGVNTNTTANAVLVVQDPCIITQPADTTVLKGATHIFSVTAAGSGTLKYQWYSITNTTIAKLTGKITSTLSVALLNTNLGYFVIVTNASGSVTSRVATATVNIAPTITGQPASFAGKAAKIAGNNVSFIVKIATNATAPLTYSWTHNGTPLATTTSNLDLVNVQLDDAGSYACTITNVGGSVTTAAGAGILAVNPDVLAPTVAFTYPAVGARLTNGIPITSGAVTLSAPNFFLAGTATDAGLITNITVTRIFPVSAPLTVNITIPGPGKVAFTNQLALVDGTNIFSISSVDNAGNVSATVTRTFFYVNNTTMLFVTNVSINTGTGTNGPVGAASLFAKFGTPTNGAPLEIGRNYTIKAVAGYNSVFTNWTDSNGLAFTTNTTLTFKMSSNLVLLANFITNPIVAGHADGKYNGLFSEEAGVTVESAGSITALTLKTNGSFSGSLNLQGKTLSLSKTFDTSGNVTFSVPRTTTSRSNVTVTLHVDWSGTTHQITGTIASTNSLGSPWSSTVLLDQVHYDPTNVTYVSDRLTLTIPSADTTGTTSPAGAGYAGVTNTIGGLSTLAGKLADGSAIASSLPISKDGNVPVSVKLYNSLGLLQGWLNYTDTNVTGSLTWIRPATNTPVTYVKGFTNVGIAVTGTNYVKSVLPATVFGSVTNLILSVSDSEGISLDNTLSPLVWHVQLKGNAFIVNTNFANPTNKISGTVAVLDGSVALSIKTTGTDKTGVKALVGNVNQNTDSAAGYFIGATNTGSFSLHP